MFICYDHLRLAVVVTNFVLAYGQTVRLVSEHLVETNKQFVLS